MRRSSWVVAVFALAAFAAGCGESATDQAVVEQGTASDPNAETFPKPRPGEALPQFVDRLDAAEAQIDLATSVFTTGHSRVAFALERAGRFLDGPTVLYAAPVADPADIAGPLTAPADRIVAGGDGDSGRLAATYDARAVDFDHPGRYTLVAYGGHADTPVVATTQIAVIQRGREPMPGVDERAPQRADSTGKPVALLLAGRDCRTCGSPRAIADELAARYGDQVEFVDPGDAAATRRRYGLGDSTWLFTIDGDGKVAARLQGAIGIDAAERAVQAAIVRSARE